MVKHSYCYCISELCHWTLMFSAIYLLNTSWKRVCSSAKGTSIFIGLVCSSVWQIVLLPGFILYWYVSVKWNYHLIVLFCNELNFQYTVTNYLLAKSEVFTGKTQTKTEIHQQIQRSQNNGPSQKNIGVNYYWVVCGIYISCFFCLLIYFCVYYCKCFRWDR